MHILLTRPLEDCSEMILKLKNLGHQISHLPLLKVEAVQYEKINLTDFNAIIFTSANAIKHLNSKDFDKDIPCFCVGNATEKKARSIGFQNVFTADGNVSNLKEIILQNFNSSDGKLLYVSGELVSNELITSAGLGACCFGATPSCRLIGAPHQLLVRCPPGRHCGSGGTGHGGIRRG